MDLLEGKSPQAFQYQMFTRCGCLVAYDFRKDKIKKEFLRQSIVERIKIVVEGRKLLFKVVITGNFLRPSSLKE